MELVSVPLAVGLVLAGVAALLAATVVARRSPLPADRRSRGSGRLAPLVPWLGTLLTIALLIRGALAGAAVVGAATLVHAGVARARASGASRQG